MCKQPEPPPTHYYSPGDRIYSAGFSFSWRVVAGPLCRVYYRDGKLEPHSLESAWRQVGGKWTKPHPNYLSYRVQGDKYITVRWQKPEKVQ